MHQEVNIEDRLDENNFLKTINKMYRIFLGAIDNLINEIKGKQFKLKVTEV